MAFKKEEYVETLSLSITSPSTKHCRGLKMGQPSPIWSDPHPGPWGVTELLTRHCLHLQHRHSSVPLHPRHADSLHFPHAPCTVPASPITWIAAPYLNFGPQLPPRSLPGLPDQAYALLCVFTALAG